MPKATPVVPEVALEVRVQKKQARFRRVRESKGPDSGIGEFFLLLDVTAENADVYIPLSIASGKKPTGFVYQIEGTKEGTISTTSISCSGTGVTQITLGTILYCKIPAGKTASFRILIEMRGKAGSEYTVAITRIHYKHDPSTARYEKFEKTIPGQRLRFS